MDNLKAIRLPSRNFETTAPTPKFGLYSNQGGGCIHAKLANTAAARIANMLDCQQPKMLTWTRCEYGTSNINPKTLKFYPAIL